MSQLQDYKSHTETPEDQQPVAVEQFAREMNDAGALGHDAPNTDDAASHVPADEKPAVTPAKAEGKPKVKAGTGDDQRAQIAKKFTEKAPEHRRGSKAFEASTDEDNYYGAGMKGA